MAKKRFYTDIVKCGKACKFFFRKIDKYTGAHTCKCKRTNKKIELLYVDYVMEIKEKGFPSWCPLEDI